MKRAVFNPFRRACACLTLAFLATAPTSPPSLAADHGMQLTLAEVVQRAFRHNPRLVSERLGRPLQAYDLEQAERRFRPKLSFGAAGLGYRFERGADAGDVVISAGPRVDVRLPTGGAVGVSPTWSAVVRDAGGTDGPDGANLSFAFTQPLFRGGGLRIGRAPVVRARIAEARNVQLFRVVAMDVVTLAIVAYRAVIRAGLQVRINERALQRANDILEVKELLVETGRMARRDLVQTRAGIARQELSLLQSRSRLEDARRDLNVLLDLDAAAQIGPAESMTVEPSPPDLGRSLARARRHHTGYLLAQLDLRGAELERMVAEDGTRWDLSVGGRASFGESEAPGWGLGGPAGDYALDLVLRVPLGDTATKAAERARLAARIAYQRAEHALATAAREMETDVRNAVRAVDAYVGEMALARQALALAEETLEIEQEKLRLGLSSAYELTRYQNDLVAAQVNDLDAAIRYLNAVAALDRAVGTVLDTWDLDADGTAE